MTPAAFRSAFPAFADETQWTDDVITARFTKSAPYFDVTRWGAFLDLGQGNWVAHDLVRNPPDGSRAATAGLVGTPATQKTVGTVSVGRSADLIKMGMENPYMLTEYGREYFRLARQRGAGAVVVNPMCADGLVADLGGPFS